jgi:metallo-beta-lactamase class B
MILRLSLAVIVSTAMATAAQQPGRAGGAPPPPDSPEISRSIEALRMKVGPKWAATVHFWCEEPRANRADDPVIEPTQIFDNVYALGNSGTTVYVIRTSAGLVMIDALGGGDQEATTAQVEAQLLPGFKKLGLDPAQVKMILVAHGHADHYGGASYFQEKYGTKVYVSAVDWNLMENPPARGGGARAGGRGPAGPPTALPRHDGDIKDGEPIKLGDLSVTPVAIPGHTPGSMAFLFPVKDQGKTHQAGIFGGAWLLPGALSEESLQTFRQSIAKYRAAAATAKVDVLLQNHMLMDPIQPKLDALAARQKGQPNPFVVGTAEYQKFLDVMDGCTQVNLARRRL